MEGASEAWTSTALASLRSRDPHKEQSGCGLDDTFDEYLLSTYNPIPSNPLIARNAMLAYLSELQAWLQPSFAVAGSDVSHRETLDSA